MRDERSGAASVGEGADRTEGHSNGPREGGMVRPAGQGTTRRAVLRRGLWALGGAGVAAWSSGATVRGASRPIAGGSHEDSERAGGGSAAACADTSTFLDAVRAGDLERVRAFADRDPGLVTVRDAEGRSAFALALLGRHRPVAALLLDRGHRPDAHEAALATDWDRLEAVAADAPGVVNRSHPIGGTAMYAAALGGAGSSIWRVYTYGGDPNAVPDPARPSALRVALDHPDLEVAELTASTLLANGATPRAGEPRGDSALHAAAARGSLELVEMMLRKGADPGAVDDDGRTPADRADREGHAEVLALLVAHRSIPRDVEISRSAYDARGDAYRAPDLEAFPPVLRARVTGLAHTDLDGVRTIVDAWPALAHAASTTTERAVEAGAHMGRRDIVDDLLERGAPCALSTSVMRGDVTRVRAVLDEHPGWINERGAHDFGLLWYTAIGGGLVEMAELLIDRGADVERQHHLGTTALHYAALGGQIELVDTLLRHGADPTRAGRKFGGARRTPIEIAEQRGHAEVAERLRRAARAR